MAPLLITYGQSFVDEYRKEMLVKEYLAKQATSSTPAPAFNMSDESSLHIESSESNESSDISLDQSNHGFSLVNVHWTSFSTGLSSVLVILLAGLLIAGCCYFRGRRQRQSAPDIQSCSTLPIKNDFVAGKQGCSYVLK